jgi:hypothetical protein
VRLRFLLDQGYEGETVRAGAIRSDISKPWAERFIEKGIAVEEKEAVTPEPPSDEPKVRKRPRKKK